MKNKKSFLLYCDLIHTVNQLPDDKAGLLMKHILSYVNDENPETDDIIVKIAFEPIKQQLKRDLIIWQNIVERNRVNGMKGGRPKKNPKNPDGLQETQDNPQEPQKADTVNDSDTVNVIYKQIVTSIPIFFSDDFPFLKEKEIKEWFTEFLKGKKEKKSSLSRLAIEQNLKNLVEHSGGDKKIMLEIIKRSVNSNWSDFFKLKKEKDSEQKKKGDPRLPIGHVV